MALLEVREATKRYGLRVALDRLDLTIAEGECYALLGPNGAGKSTLIRAICTLTGLDAGSIRAGGVDAATDAMAVRRIVGVAFQEPLLDKHLSAREAIDHHARLYGVTPAERKVRMAQLAAQFAIGDRLDERVTRLSGGLRRRVDLARALVTQPRLLILDEPTAGLDLAARRRLDATIRSLADRGVAVLVATHDMDEAEAVADRVGILHRGRLIAEGAPAALKQGLGWKVVRIATQEAGRLGETLAAEEGIEEVVAVPGGLEITVPERAGSAAHVIELLESRGIRYESATVRDPTLGDLFLKLTGRELADEAAPRDGRHDDETHAALDAALDVGPELGREASGRDRDSGGRRHPEAGGDASRGEEPT